MSHYSFAHAISKAFQEIITEQNGSNIVPLASRTVLSRKVDQPEPGQLNSAFVNLRSAGGSLR